MSKKSIVCFGDSITHCQIGSELGRWTGQLAARLEADSAGEFEVFNRGIGGHTTTNALDRIQADVLPLLPGVVLIEFGINDAYVFPWAAIPRVSVSEYRRNLREIVRQIQQKNGIPILVINHELTERTDLHPQGNGQPVGYNLIPYNLAMEELVQETSVAAIHLPRLLMAAGHSPDALLAPDGIHLSPAGNSIYAELIFTGLKPILAKTIP